MIFNDGSQYRVVTDPEAHMAERDMFCFRAASARDGAMYVDTAFDRHRTQLAPMKALLLYQFVYGQFTPEAQADFFLAAVDGLRWNEMVMLDIESGGGIPDPAGFARRWLDAVEPALQCRAWVYVPRALNAALRPVIGDRIVMAPRYSGTAQRGTPPDWPWDVHQYSDRGPFPGVSAPGDGDVSFTELQPEAMLARCNPSGMGASPCHEGDAP